MNHRIRLAQKPPQRVFPIPLLEVALVIATELQHFGNLLKWQVEAGLAEGIQLLPDACNGRLGRQRHGVVDGQDHDFSSLLGINGGGEFVDPPFQFHRLLKNLADDDFLNGVGTAMAFFQIGQQEARRLAGFGNGFVRHLGSNLGK